MDIRKAGVNDINAIVANRMEFIRNIDGQHEVEIPGDFEGNTNACLKELIEDNSLVAWMAIDQDVIASIAMVCFYQVLPLMSNRSGKMGYLLNVYTLPEYRGKGLATTVLNKIIEEAKNRNVGKLYLNATDAGMPLYKKLGFEVLSRDMALVIK